LQLSRGVRFTTTHESYQKNQHKNIPKLYYNNGGQIKIFVKYIWKKI